MGESEALTPAQEVRNSVFAIDDTGLTEDAKADADIAPAKLRARTSHNAAERSKGRSMQVGTRFVAALAVPTILRSGS